MGQPGGDHDKDGFIDLFVPQTEPGGFGPAKHWLYHNNGNGTFSLMTSGPIATVVSAGFGAARGWVHVAINAQLDSTRDLD